MRARRRHSWSEMAGKVVLMQERTDDALKKGQKHARLPLAGATLPLLHPFVVCSS